MSYKRKSTTTKKLSNFNERRDETLTESFKPVKKTTARRGTDKNEAKEVVDDDKVNIVNLQEILKEFDLDINYGPIIGISRTDRLRRAEYFNLSINFEVKKILHDEKLLKQFPELDFNIWNDIDDNTFMAINKY